MIGACRLSATESNFIRSAIRRMGIMALFKQFPPLVGQALRGLLVGCVVLLCAFLGLLEPGERWGLNQLFALRGASLPHTPVVIVSIAEDSFDELNLAWPWPRALHGELLDRISQGHPAVVGFDILFPEPSARGPEDDRALAEAVERAGPVVLAAALTTVQDDRYLKEDLNAPIATIRQRAAGFGFVNLVLDSDAVVRSAEAGRKFQGQEIPGFASAVARAAFSRGIASMPSAAVPFLINYRGGPKTFRTIPYYQVLTGEVSPEVFTGKIVLVGATSPILHDVYPTPVSPSGEMAGVEIQANVLDNLLAGDPLRRTPRALAVLCALLAGVMSVWLTNRLRPLAGLGAAIGIGLAYGGVVAALFLWDRRVMELLPVPLALLVGYGATVIENFVKEQQQRALLMQLFSKHVSPEIAETIWRQRADFLEGGRLRSQKATATVLFSDLKDFTPVAEQLDAQALMGWLNDYTDRMAQVVMKHGGVVDDYYGDAIKANFGVPFAQASAEGIARDATRAVECALAMGEELRRLNGVWASRGLPSVGMRIGICTGDLVAGCVGSAQRMKFTTVGHTVNTASHLESFEKELGQDDLTHNPCRILIGESTAGLLGGKFWMDRVGALSLKGKSSSVMVYRVFGAIGERPSAVPAPNQRKFLRVPLNGEAFVSNGFQANGTMRDLSIGGLAMSQLAQSLAVGKSAQLRLGLPGEASPVCARGTVVWATSDRAGFAFQEMSESDRIVLQNFLDGQRGKLESVGAE